MYVGIVVDRGIFDELEQVIDSAARSVNRFPQPRVVFVPWSYRKFGFQNTELYRHYVRFDCAIAQLKALGN